MSDNVTDRQRAVSSDIIEKIMNDADFRTQLVEAPEAALRNAGFLEKLEDLQGEVSGYAQSIEDSEASTWCCVTVIY